MRSAHYSEQTPALGGKPDPAVGFALIELIVVIPIVVILAALLFLALSRARGRALVLKCVSNLHQIGIDLKSNLGENSETFRKRSDWLVLGGIDARLLGLFVTAGQTFRCPADWGAR